MFAFYTNYYLEGDRRQDLVLYIFMASMLGLVWSDDLQSSSYFGRARALRATCSSPINPREYKGAVEGRPPR